VALAERGHLKEATEAVAVHYHVLRDGDT